MSAFERSMIRLTRAGVVIGLITLFIFGGQLYEMIEGGTQTDKLVNASQSIRDALNLSNAQNQGALKDTLTQNRQAMNASNAQSKAALDATIQSAHLDQRAWVVVKGIEGVPQLDQPWDIHVVFTNTGKTPAKNVRMSCKAEHKKSIDDFVFKEASRVQQTTLIAPNQEPYCDLPMTTRALPKITKDVLDTLGRKNLIVAVFGSVTYEDVFRRPHWLTFCRLMQPDGKAWDDCKTGNDTGDGNPPN